jgi:hypothetical protein
MARFIGGIVVTLLLSSLTTPAFAACVNAKCTDAAAIEQARAMIQSSCGCTRTGQTHGKYTKCVKGALKLANITALIPDKPCRKLIMKCENSSICGKPNAAVCCVTKKNGTVKASIVKTASKCKGSACGALLGLYSTSDGCASDGTCAGPISSSTTTTTLVSHGSVLKGALTSTAGRFNYNLTLGLPGANAACNTNFSGTHACTYAELQSAQAAGDLAGLKDVGQNTVTSFWAIDSGQPPLQQCNDDVSSHLNWEYATAHTGSRGQKVTLDNQAGTLGPLQSGLQCNVGGASWVGCCQ